jgi:hypothetical protein
MMISPKFRVQILAAVTTLMRGIALVGVVGAPVAVHGSPGGRFLPNLTEIVRPAVTIRSLDDATVDLRVALPLHHAINREAPGRVTLRLSSLGDVLVGESPLDEPNVSVPVHIPPDISARPSENELVVEAVVYYCEETKKAVCKIKSLRIFQPVTIEPASTTAAIVIDGAAVEAAARPTD